MLPVKDGNFCCVDGGGGQGTGIFCFLEKCGKLAVSFV